MDRFLAVASGPALDFLRGLQGRAYLAPMWDLDARFRSMDAVEGYAQVLTLCLPPIEQMAHGAQAVDLARLSNDSMADLVRRYPERFVGFAASLPLEDVDGSMRELERAVARAWRARGAGVHQLQWSGDGRSAVRAAVVTPGSARVRGVGARRASSRSIADFVGEERSRYGLWAALGWPYEMGMFAARMVASGRTRPLSPAAVLSAPQWRDAADVHSARQRLLAGVAAAGSGG